MITRAEKKHHKKVRQVLQGKVWNTEFLRYQLKSLREGFRMEHDRLKEMLDASVRRLGAEKYDLFYCATGDPIEAKSIPIDPNDIERLPDSPEDTKDFRFYKKPRECNENVVKNLENMIEKYRDNLKQLEAQLTGIDGQLEGPQSTGETLEKTRTAINLLDEYLKLREQYD